MQKIKFLDIKKHHVCKNERKHKEISMGTAKCIKKNKKNKNIIFCTLFYFLQKELFYIKKIILFQKELFYKIFYVKDYFYYFMCVEKYDVCKTDLFIVWMEMPKLMDTSER